MKTICIDFDGVIHSYTSGWKGISEISDKPVPGAIEALALYVIDPEINVAIHSVRSRSIRGRHAMRAWLRQAFEDEIKDIAEGTRKYNVAEAWKWAVLQYTEMSGEERYIDAARQMVNKIQFPRDKPPAIMYLDDRSVRFEGTFPTTKWILKNAKKYSRDENGA